MICGQKCDTAWISVISRSLSCSVLPAAVAVSHLLSLCNLTHCNSQHKLQAWKEASEVGCACDRYWCRLRFKRSNGLGNKGEKR